MEVREHSHQVGLGQRLIFMYNMSILGASWGWDGVCLLLVIGGSVVDQGGVGGLGTLPSGQARSEDHFYA